MSFAAATFLRAQLRRRSEHIPVGVTWSSVIAVDVSVVITVLIATLQRPAADLPVSLAAFAVAIAPAVTFLVFNLKLYSFPVWLGWSAATAALLFATATPVRADFAPALAILTVLVVATLSSVLAGFLAAMSALALLLVASALHRLDAVALYVGFVAAAWLLGYLMRTQRMLLGEQLQAQRMLAEHAAADERRRVAREVHDVIAHSLSITMLHVTGARRVLQQDRDVDDAIEALEQAEQLGRQAMADIRRTVGLLDDSPTKAAQTKPEPGLGDITDLVQDFERAGLDVTALIGGATQRVSAGIGLALYRITQESLANIAKHAPDSKSCVSLDVSEVSVRLDVNNKMPAAVAASRPPEGRGLSGMRQRVEILGGAIDVGPTRDGWSVCVEIPLNERDTAWRPWWCKA